MIESSIDIRQATLNDVEGIATVKRLVWPGEDVNVAQISRAIAHEQHVTHVAVDGTTIVGFVDGFLTQNPSSRLRWEVDLLAIHPAYRGRQYGARLVEQTTQVGRQRGVHVVRGLIRVNNIASQRTFARCAYRQIPDIRTLYVASPEGQKVAIHAFAQNWNAIPVTTLTYNGWWLEATLQEQGNTLLPCLNDLKQVVVGIVLGNEETAFHRAAQSSGFIAIGQFHEWQQVICNAKKGKPAL